MAKMYSSKGVFKLNVPETILIGFCYEKPMLAYTLPSRFLRVEEHNDITFYY